MYSNKCIYSTCNIVRLFLFIIMITCNYIIIIIKFINYYSFIHMYIIIYITYEDTHTLKKKPSFTRCPDNASGLVPSDVGGFLTRDPRGLLGQPWGTVPLAWP